jgi:hypothetical protein
VRQVCCPRAKSEKSRGLLRLGENGFEERIVGMRGEIGSGWEILHPAFLTDDS